MAEGGRVRALLVEDNPLSQEVARKMLVRLGCRVDAAASGEDALALLERGPFDIVFLDCDLPGLSGFETAMEVRRRENGGPRRPIVGVTAHGAPADRERCLAAGMDDHLSKPVTLDGFRRVLARWAGVEDSGGCVAPAVAALTVATACDEAPVLEEARLAALARLPGGHAMLGRLVDRLMEAAPADLARIEDAASGGDADGLREAAHALRGACLNLGVSGLAALLTRVEELAASGDLERAATAATGVRAEIARARQALAEYLGRGARRS